MKICILGLSLALTGCVSPHREGVILTTAATVAYPR